MMTMTWSKTNFESTIATYNTLSVDHFCACVFRFQPIPDREQADRKRSLLVNHTTSALLNRHRCPPSFRASDASVLIQTTDLTLKYGIRTSTVIGRRRWSRTGRFRKERNRRRIRRNSFWQFACIYKNTFKEAQMDNPRQLLTLR
jgi:hypothetical protein